MAQQQKQDIEAWGSSPEPTLTQDAPKYYNILSTDGGGIRGIIPTQTIAYLEDGTYEYALKKGYIQPKPEGMEKKLFMPQFFDLLAGTSIGGLISAVLTTPNPEYPTDVARPMYSTTKALELLTTKGGIIFQKIDMSLAAKIIWGLVIFIFGAVLSYYLGYKCFKNKHYEDQLEQVEKHISCTTEVFKENKVDDDGTATNKLTQQLQVALLAKVRLEGDPEINKMLEENSAVTLCEARFVLLKRKKHYYSKQKCIWVVFVIGCMISAIFAWFLPFTIYFATKSSTYGRANLDQQLSDTFGETLLISQSLTELCIVSYEYISQTARVYSRWSSAQNPGIYDVTFYDAAGATSAAPYYFDPKILTTPNGQVEYLIDGGVIANNPSQYAEQVASVNKNNLPVRVISLGTGAYESKPINPDEFTTMDWWKEAGFMTTSISQKNSAVVSEYQAANYVRIQCVSNVALDGTEDVDKLLEQGSAMTLANKDILDELIEILVEEQKTALQQLTW